MEFVSSDARILGCHHQIWLSILHHQWMDHIVQWSILRQARWSNGGRNVHREGSGSKAVIGNQYRLLVVVEASW